MLNMGHNKNSLPEFFITLVTFIIFDAKMYFEMPFVMLFIFISIWTILTFMKIIIVNLHMFLQFSFCGKARLAIWLRTFVPKIYIRTHCVHFAMKIQVFLEMKIQLKRCVKRLPLRNRCSCSEDQNMDTHHSCELLPCALSNSLCRCL